MDIREITICIEASNRMKEADEKRRAAEIYNLAALMGNAYAASNPLNKGRVKFPAIYEVFPTYFEKPKPKQQDWRKAKEILMNFAKAHNQNSRGKANDS